MEPAMTVTEITAEADYRWAERAAILAGERKELTEQERMIASKEAIEFENQERAKHAYEDTGSI